MQTLNVWLFWFNTAFIGLLTQYGLALIQQNKIQKALYTLYGGHKASPILDGTMDAKLCQQTFWSQP